MLVFLLIPLKFAFAGHLLARGFESVNSAIEAITRDELEDAEGRLKKVGELQKRFAFCFIQLTEAMTAELILIMLYGVITEVSLMMNIINVLSMGTPTTFLIDAVLFLLSAGVALAGPCEACHRLLSLTGRRCDLLLELEWQRPQLAREAGLQRAAALRHMDTFGDLGLFQARRSTLLAASATIVTYIVVIAQFQTSDNVCNCDEVLSSNASAVL